VRLSSYIFKNIITVCSKSADLTGETKKELLVGIKSIEELLKYFGIEIVDSSQSVVGYF
jgi:hypothetical protein